MKIIVMDSANLRIEVLNVADHMLDLTIIGDEKNDRGNEHEIAVDDIFAGQMEYITETIGE